MHYNWSLLQAIEDLDLSVQGFYNYGKGFIKTCKVKAFIMPYQTLFVVGNTVFHVHLFFSLCVRP